MSSSTHLPGSSEGDAGATGGDRGPGYRVRRAALGSPDSAPPLMSPAQSSDADSLSPTPTPESNMRCLEEEVANISLGGGAAQSPAAHMLSPPANGSAPTAHKKAGSSSIQIPPSRSFALATAAAAAAAASAGSSSATPASSSSSSHPRSTSGSSSATPAAPRPRRNKLHGTSRRFEQDYKLLPNCMLGSGASGSVFVCTSLRDPSHEYAVKIIPKSANDLDPSAFREEMTILAGIRHRNIIRLKDVYESATTGDVYIVTELAYGGDFFDRILKTKAFSERDVVGIARKLFHACAYLHSRGIVHRDLKPENILFSTRDPDSDIKISDFGFARNLLTKPRNLRAKTQLGTYGFMAPELFSGEPYSERCDVWSLAIVVYICLCGLPPFVSPEDIGGHTAPFWIYTNAMNSRAKKAVEFPDALGWRYISPQAKAFLASALELDPARRMRAVDALQHPWLKRRGGGGGRGGGRGGDRNISSTMAPSLHSAASSSHLHSLDSTTATSSTTSAHSPASSSPSAASVSASTSTSADPSSTAAAAASPPSKHNLHQTNAMLNRYLTFTLNKGEVDGLRMGTAGAGSQLDEGALLPPAGDVDVDLLRTAPSTSTHASAGVGSMIPPPSSMLVRSSSHDLPSDCLLPPSTSASPSASRVDSMSMTRGGSASGQRHNSTGPTESNVASPRGSVLYSNLEVPGMKQYAESAPPSANFSRHNSAMSHAALGTGAGVGMQEQEQGQGPFFPMTPMSPLVAHPDAESDATALAPLGSPPMMSSNRANLSYEYVFAPVPAAAVATATAHGATGGVAVAHPPPQGILRAHDRTNSTSSYGSASSGGESVQAPLTSGSDITTSPSSVSLMHGGVGTHTRDSSASAPSSVPGLPLSRRLRAGPPPALYATLPQQYINAGEDDEDEEDLEPEFHSSEEEGAPEGVAK